MYAHLMVEIKTSIYIYIYIKLPEPEELTYNSPDQDGSDLSNDNFSKILLNKYI